MNQRSQSAPTPAEQSDSHGHVAHRRCYTATQIIGFLQISERSFFDLKRRGHLPFLEELRPRLGRTVRYRADLVDRYLSGRWQSVDRPHGGRKPAAVPSTPAMTKKGMTV